MKKYIKRKLELTVLGSILGASVFWVSFSMAIMIASLLFKATAAATIGALLGLTSPLALGVAFGVGALALTLSSVLISFYHKHNEVVLTEGGVAQMQGVEQASEYALASMLKQSIDPRAETRAHFFIRYAITGAGTAFITMLGVLGGLTLAHFGFLSSPALLVVLLAAAVPALFPYNHLIAETLTQEKKLSASPGVGFGRKSVAQSQNVTTQPAPRSLMALLVRTGLFAQSRQALPPAQILDPVPAQTQTQTVAPAQTLDPAPVPVPVPDSAKLIAT